jgi:hypothetical protein
MFHFLKTLFLGLAVLAVGMVQVLGVHGGYVCECTGKQVVSGHCDVGCHGDGEALHEDAGGERGNVVANEVEDDHHHAPSGEHKHWAFRKAFVVGGAAVSVVVSAPGLMWGDEVWPGYDYFANAQVELGWPVVRVVGRHWDMRPRALVSLVKKVVIVV